MTILDINGLHLEVVPFKKNDLELLLFRLCFNGEISIIVDQEKLDEIDEVIFVKGLENNTHSSIDSFAGSKYYNMLKNDIDKRMSNFMILVTSNDKYISINVKTPSKLKELLVDHIYTINKSDKKEINKFRKKIGDMI